MDVCVNVRLFQNISIGFAFIYVISRDSLDWTFTMSLYVSEPSTGETSSNLKSNFNARIVLSSHYCVAGLAYWSLEVEFLLSQKTFFKCNPFFVFLCNHVCRTCSSCKCHCYFSITTFSYYDNELPVIFR